MTKISRWMTVAVGVVHVAFTARDFDHASLDALWFAGSGLAVMLIGALTLPIRRRPSGGRPSRRTSPDSCVGFGILTGFSGPQGPPLIALFLAGAAAGPTRRRA